MSDKVTLIVGVGSDHGDDRLGWHVAQRLEARAAPNLTIRTARTPAERETLLTQAKLRYEASPRDEAAALDYAKTLTVLQRRREALDVLIAAGRRLPTSVRIEREIIQAYQRLHDDVGREQYFAQRVRDQPARRDLAVLHVRSLYDLGKSTEAAEALTRVVAAMPEADRVLVQLDMARGLRKSSRHEESAALFAAVVTAAPERYDVRRELAALPDDAPYVDWGRWFLSDSPTRPIAPGFTITPAEARKLAEEMTREQTGAAAAPAPPVTPAP